jgi:hypothetical protein
MGLDRGVLARIDRKAFSGLGRDEGWQMVRVPVAAAVWSTWRRYCALVGVSMGRGIAGLIAHELETAVTGHSREAVFGQQAERQASERMSRLDAREREIDAREKGIRSREQQLREAERRFRAREVHRAPPGSAGRVKVGRNERCPCGSGQKYKHCHGPG